MTENKQPPKKIKNQQGAKASVGAWWKSIVPQEQPKEEGPGTASPAAPILEAEAHKQDNQNAQDVARTPATALARQTEHTDAVDPSAVQHPESDAAYGHPAAEASAPQKRTRRSRKRVKKAESITADPAVEDSVEDAKQDLFEDPEEPESDDVRPEIEIKRDPKAVYKLLVNAEEPEECRVALLENGKLESFHVSTVEREATKNNIYKGRIVSIEANLQVAFVDIGTGKNGFLPFGEIHPEYYRENISERARELISQQQWRKLKIEEVMQKGQEVLVQVVKEVTGNKGANMTTYLSLPGRCLVLLPGSDSAGISRKIVGEQRRGELREMMSELELPEGIGYIVRTASAEITRVTLKEDLERLLQLWEQIRSRGQVEQAPALIYQEQDTVVRFLRDHFFPEIQEIVVDTDETLEQVQDFIQQLPPKQRQVRVRQHRGVKPIFNQHNIEEQIESIYRPQVPLPSGGSIVIDPTEALVAIDVNSGRTSKNSDFEESIFLANMEAAEELARQLRLRDLGGLIVVDFIDMRSKKHILEVERQVKASMKRDKAKVDISRISRFGLMQISRQKMGAPTAKGSYITCTHCQGRGVVRSVETQALYYLRRIQTGIIRKKVSRVECSFPLEVAQYLLNRKKEELVTLERQHNATIDITVRADMLPSEHEMEFLGSESAS
ncbi:MAG: Rne/Rng family ribonuclease [Desulfobulbaceae bacterium]|nr:Rne/Rng family ribonuclease [Desulfobulbaceae bacterium]